MTFLDIQLRSLHDMALAGRTLKVSEIEEATDLSHGLVVLILINHLG